jgi:hypothetical protein
MFGITYDFDVWTYLYLTNSEFGCKLVDPASYLFLPKPTKPNLFSEHLQIKINKLGRF